MLMFKIIPIKHLESMFIRPELNYKSNKTQFYRGLQAEIAHYYSDYGLSNLSNTSSFLKEMLPDINWVGFYILEGTTLRLGPFQGLPACLDIEVGRGVCGTSALQKKTLVVPDVEEFPGHIACDSNSKSEIVIPLFLQGQFFGVLDIDSPLLNRFDREDQEGLELIAAKMMESFSNKGKSL